MVWPLHDVLLYAKKWISTMHLKIHLKKHPKTTEVLPYHSVNCSKGSIDQKGPPLQTVCLSNCTIASFKSPDCMTSMCCTVLPLTWAWSVMYRPTFSQSLMLQCLMVGQAPWPLTHTAEPTGGGGITNTPVYVNIVPFITVTLSTVGSASTPLGLHWYYLANSQHIFRQKKYFTFDIFSAHLKVLHDG